MSKNNLHSFSDLDPSGKPHDEAPEEGGPLVLVTTTSPNQNIVTRVSQIENQHRQLLSNISSLHKDVDRHFLDMLSIKDSLLKLLSEMNATVQWNLTPNVTTVKSFDPFLSLLT